MNQNHRILSYANVEIYGPHNEAETIWPPLEGIAPEFEIFAGSIANGDWHCLTDFEYEFEVSRDYAKRWLLRLQLFGRCGVESDASRDPIAPKFFYLDKCELQLDLLFGPEVCKLLAAEFAESRDFARFDWSKLRRCPRLPMKTQSRSLSTIPLRKHFAARVLVAQSWLCKSKFGYDHFRGRILGYRSGHPPMGGWLKRCVASVKSQPPEVSQESHQIYQ